MPFTFLRRSIDSTPSTWIVLPSPMSSARHAPSPRLRSSHSHCTPVFWYGRSRARSPAPASISARIFGERRASSCARSHLPATTCDHCGRACTSASSCNVSPAPGKAAPANMRIASAKVTPPSAAWACTSRHCASSSVSLSWSTSTHLPLIDTNPSLDASNASISFADSFLPSRVSATSKSTSASIPNVEGGLPPTDTDTCGRRRVGPLHQSGTRTTMPACSYTGTSRRNAYACAAVHDSGW